MKAAAMLVGVAQAMPTIELAPGVRLPFVSLGTGSGQHGDVANATVDWLRLGGTSIDTAYNYKDEPEIAVGLQRSGVPRDQVFLLTKIPCGTYDDATQHIDSNLKQLQVEQVDLTIIHQQCHTAAQAADTWRALEDAQTAGKTKTIGVSNFEISDLEALAKTQRVAPVLNQYSHSVKYHNDELIEYSRSKGIVHMAYSPLCGGFNGSSCTHGNVLKLPELLSIGAAHNVSSAQVALKWIVQRGHPLATAVWIPEYMSEDLDLWSWGNLTAPEMQTLDGLAQSGAITV
jgi:diketogulonate reductase-like aldo/keto reductase